MNHESGTREVVVNLYFRHSNVCFADMPPLGSAEEDVAFGGATLSQGTSDTGVVITCKVEIPEEAPQHAQEAVAHLPQTVQDTAYVVVELVSRVAKSQGTGVPQHEALQDVMAAVMRAMSAELSPADLTTLFNNRYKDVASPGKTPLSTPLQVSYRNRCSTC